MPETERLRQRGANSGLRAEPRRSRVPLILAALAAGVWVLVVFGLIRAPSSACITTAVDATSIGTVASYLSALGMMVSAIMMFATLVLVLFAGNENMHYATVRNLKVSISGLLVSAAIVPLTGVIGCVAL